MSLCALCFSSLAFIYRSISCAGFCTTPDTSIIFPWTPWTFLLDPQAKVP